MARLAPEERCETEMRAGLGRLDLRLLTLELRGAWHFREICGSVFG